jgi:hypothetical protein
VDKLLADGYEIRRTERDFELASVSRELIEKFAKRTLEIERLCKEKYTILGARARKLVRETGMVLRMRSPRSKQSWALNRANPRRRSNSAGRSSWRTGVHK